LESGQPGQRIMEQITTDTASALRELWFRYLGTIEPVRPRLHGYCLKLTARSLMPKIFFRKP
jgi:hypothetical protein